MSHSRRWIVAAAATLLPALPAIAALSQASPLPVAQARSQLLRMHAAATQRNYQGTLMVSAAGQISSSRVSHFVDGTQTYERLELLDGRARQVLRHNDQVVTIWPVARRARIEQRDSVASFPAVLTGNDDLIFDRYDMIAEGEARVAGHSALVYLLQPRDQLRFAQRLWAEQSSGLLLRADMVGPEGHVLETVAFTDVSIGVRAQVDTVTGPMRRLEGYTVTKAAPRRTSLDAEGWRLGSPAAGFREVSCVIRRLEDGEGEHGSKALQAIYSDGLTHVSVFIETPRGDRHRTGHGVLGATHTLMLQHAGHLITVMGDVPLATLKQFAAALERRR